MQLIFYTLHNLISNEANINRPCSNKRSSLEMPDELILTGL